MKVSLKTVDYYLGEKPNINDVDTIVSKVGQQLGAVEEVINYGQKYDGIVVAKVIACEKHQNADKLSVCKIDDSGVVQNVERDHEGLVQVVCGAPNVRTGLTVAWIPPGAVVPATTEKDPFMIESREIRGVMSNGMLASASELALNNDHDGILEIRAEDVREENTVPGTPFKYLYGLDDVIIDIENKMFTHRPDCFGVLGVAREISGIFNEKFSSPEWYVSVPVIQDSNELQLEVINEIPELVPRFTAVALNNVEIKSSPIWMQALLSRVGIKPINNVVDITNYLSYVTAQPLHAYDYDKVSSLSKNNAVLVARFPKDGEKVELLNGKTIEPRSEAIMIATDNELIGVGGVMGGVSTEVDENTKNIILECANFDMYSIRKTSMNHGLFTDAVTRFNKGQSKFQNPAVLTEAISMMNQLAGAKVASKLIDLCNELNEIEPILTSSDFINKRLGTELSVDEIKEFLENVEFEVSIEDDRRIKITPPFWRTDVHIAEDVVEEVGRLYGFDKISTSLPKKVVTPSVIEPKIKTKQNLRRVLASMGANEVLTYSFVNGELLKKSFQDTDIAFKLSNAISPELQYYRMSLTPNLLNHVHQNIKLNFDKFAIYEIGSVHAKTEIGEDGVPKEFGRVSLVLADKLSKSTGFYQARAYLDGLGLSCLKFQNFDNQLLDQHKLMAQMFSVYDPERSAYITNSDGQPVGVIGEFKQSIIRSFKLPNHCAGFEVFLSAFKETKKPYRQLSRFPSVSQDVCLEVKIDTKFGDIEEALKLSAEKCRPEDCVFDMSLVDIFASESIENKKRVTFRFFLQSYERTLVEGVVSDFVQNIVADVSKSIELNRI